MSADPTRLQRLKLLREEVEIRRKLADLRKSNGLAFYRPHRKQDLFHKAGNFRGRYVRTGNRFGKSDMGSAEDVAFCVGERTWYPKGSPERRIGIPDHPVKLLIITTDWDKATEIFTSQSGDIGKLFLLLPPDLIDRVKRNHSGSIDLITLKNGSSIHLDTVKSFMQNPMGQESSAWDAIHVDEPCPKEMFIAASRGLMDRNGKFWFTCTPLWHPWMNDMFVSRHDNTEDGLPIIKDDRWMITGSIYDNPYITREAIEAYEKTLSDEEIQCRIHGIPLALSGMVYKEFSWDKHVYSKTPFGWESMNNPPKNYTIRYAIDPHPKTPHAVLFAATSPFGHVYFFEEIFEKVLIGELCERIKQRIKGRFVVDSICDPIAWIESPRDGTCMADDIMASGLFVEKAPKDLTRGILCVKENLTIPENWFFASNLRETLFEFDHYMWDQEKNGIERNKPKDKDDHMMENLYRLALGGLEYVEPPTADDYAPIEEESFDTPNFDIDF